MAYTVINVANSLLKVAREKDQQFVTPLQLQKLVYLAQGVALAISDGQEPLFSERIEAWQYGPVVQELYRSLKSHGASPITEPITSAYDWFGPGLIPKDDKRSWEILEIVWDSYKHLSPSQLVALTHRPTIPEGYPWHEAWEERNGKENEATPISVKVMTEQFKKIASVN